jgi:hypothetical protein
VEATIGTIAAVGITGAITSLVQIWRDRQKAKVDFRDAQRRHQWDMEDRAARNLQVLGAIADNTEVSNKAFAVANNVNQKLLSMDAKLAVAIPDTAAILSEMMQVTGQVSQADIARVLVAIQRNAATLETYAHKSVHDINGALAVLQAEARKREIDDIVKPDEVVNVQEPARQKEPPGHPGAPA